MIIQNVSNPSCRKKLDLTPYGRPYKVLLLACAANCNAGTILAIRLWKGEGEGNAQARLRVQLGYPISVCQKTPADHNEVRIPECRALVQCTAGTQLGITRGVHVGL